MKKHLAIILLALMTTACTNKNSEKTTTGSISVNGTTLAYETFGEGQPVLLIHGNGGSHHDLDTLAHQLAKAGYKVYAPDSRGHGDNPPLKEYHYADMAEDMYQFCQQLNIEKPIIYGWSDGGIIALVLEMAHPGTAHSMVVSGANIYPGKRIDELYGGSFFAEIDLDNPLDAMMFCEPDIEAEALKAITCPVLVTAGINDLIPEPHTRLIAESLPNAQLLILPDEDHFSYIVDSPKIGEIMLDFLSQPK